MSCRGDGGETVKALRIIFDDLAAGGTRGYLELLVVGSIEYIL
jgi:hypothetical protein